MSPGRRTGRLAIGVAALAAVVSQGPAGLADRYAVLAASNLGWAGEVPLRFAHADAARLAATLTELGDFPRQNVHLVSGATPRSIEAALRAIARQMSRAGAARHLLFFFYSGHADEKALHPGRRALPYGRLKELLAMVPADIRIGVIDSCKSGALTRMKGASPGPSYEVVLQGDDQVAGDVLITSAAAEENAQESERLQGSFFSAFVTSGLRGSADANRDGLVTVSELYTFAYRMTVGRTFGTRAGTQHPAHRIDLRGRGEVVLTRPGRSRCCLVFDGGRPKTRYLVLRDSDESMVAEVAGTSPAARIGLVPGRYRVRRWTSRGVFEQRVDLLAGECARVKEERMKKILLPATLSKGELAAETWSLGLAYLASVASVYRSTLPVHHGMLWLRVPLGRWALRPFLQLGAGEYAAEMGRIETLTFSAGGAATRDFPTAVGLFGLGPVLAYTLAHQVVTFSGDSDPRGRSTSSGLLLGGTGTWAMPLPWWRLAVGAEARVAYAVCGLGHDVVHQPVVDLALGLLCWF